MHLKLDSVRLGTNQLADGKTVVGAVFVELDTTRRFLRILSVSGGHKGGWPEWKQSTE